MLKQAENRVKIEGILSEIDLTEGSFKKDGQDMPMISGSIKIRVDTTINGKEETLEIPVHMFSSKYTRTGSENPAYTSMSQIIHEYKSIAAVGIDNADRVRITNGSIGMNEYWNRNDQLTSFPRVSASFVTRINKVDCHPDASWTAVFVIASADYEKDKDGVETGVYTIKGIVPQYGGKVDVVPFKTSNEGVINAVSSYWEPGNTVRAAGKLNFTSVTEEVMQKVDFGEAAPQTRTTTISDLVITGGSSEPLDGDFAYDNGEIKTALEERTARLNDLKARAKSTTDFSSPASGKAPSAKSTNPFNNLGF